MTSTQGTILITGATGFLGSRLTERLLQDQWDGDIIAVGRSLKAHNQLQAPNLHYRLGSLSDPAYVGKLFDEHDIRLVVNCAALSSPWGEYEDFYQANVVSQQLLIAAAEAAGVARYVHISTPSIYFDFTDRANVRETDPLPAKPVNHYAATKLMADKLLEASSLEWIALRPRALIGRWDTVIMPRVIRAADEGRLRIIGDGNNLVDLTPVSNVVDAILLSLQAEEQALGKVYNISNGVGYPIWDILEKALERLGKPLPERKAPEWLVMGVAAWMERYSRWFQGGKEPALTKYGVGTISQSFTMDISRARTLLGYEPRQSADDGIEEFMTWYQSLSHDL